MYIYLLHKCQWNIIRLGFLVLDSEDSVIRSCLGTNFSVLESEGANSLTF